MTAARLFSDDRNFSVTRRKKEGGAREREITLSLSLLFFRQERNVATNHGLPFHPLKTILINNKKKSTL